jgi:hypothetical protein
MDKIIIGWMDECILDGYIYIFVHWILDGLLLDG